MVCDAVVNNFGIVGYGAVGKAVHEIFPGARIFDGPLGIGNLEDLAEADVVFVCVPTPPNEDGSCDTSIVEDVVAQLTAEIIVIRSTVVPGTTSRLRDKYGKRIVFQPEYIGEAPSHPFASEKAVTWVILGGAPGDTAIVADVYRAANPLLSIEEVSSETAELAKYMENAFLATRVAFANEFFDLARAVGVDYDRLREVWLLDPRMGPSHTLVSDESRGFGGRCLPKDLSALLAFGELALGYQPETLAGVAASNARVRHPQA